MTEQTLQASFNGGEWAPYLYARVDQQKYRSGTALLRNFFVDYRGGATVSPGTAYVAMCKDSTLPVRLIPFQASLDVSYVLEFGEEYIRFYTQGAPVLEDAIAITAATNADPCVLTLGSSLTTGDWIFVSGVGGMTELNGNYYILGSSGTTVSLKDLFGNDVDSTAFGTYTTGGTVQRVYTLTSPYLASEVFALKFAQNVDRLVICHTNHAPQQLVLTSATSWAISAITFASTVTTPTGTSASSSLGAGSVNYAYKVSAVDASGQESAATAAITLSNLLDIRTNPGTNFINWAAVTGAVSYNVYKANVAYSASVPGGAAYGFIGNVTGTSMNDSNISPDFSQSIPIVQNPFQGSGVASIIMTAGGNYVGLPVPTVTLTAAPSGGVTATAQAFAYVNNVGISVPGTGYAVGNVVTSIEGIVLYITQTGAFGAVDAINILDHGNNLFSGTVQGNDQPTSGCAGTGFRVNLEWKLGIQLINPGAGYAMAPSVNISGTGGASATTTIGAPAAGNPTVPSFFQQRLVLAGPVGSPQQFNMSQTGAFYNFNTSVPVKANDAIQATIASDQLNNIQALVSQPYGLIILSNNQAWLVNGGSAGSAVTPASVVANPQIYTGCSSLTPIIANDNIIYVQAKNSVVRNLIYNYYTQIYTGNDISIFSSHLFYGYRINDWAWAEEPNKLLWAVRSDGEMLTLTFLREQELIAWSHRDTEGGAFKSVASVPETTVIGKADAVYVVVERTVNGTTVKYIERMAEQYYPNGATDAWQVDCAIQYNGAATLSFTGAQHLSGLSVTGLATDDLGNVTIIPAFTVAYDGAFTLDAPPSPATGYTRVTLGIGITAQLQTLALDLGEPTVQGKVKKINSVDVRVVDTLNLEIGQDFDHLVDMKDLRVGNVSSMLTGQQSQLIEDLFTGDARTFLSPAFTVPGQYCIQQSDPYPATILGVFPNVTPGEPRER